MGVLVLLTGDFITVVWARNHVSYDLAVEIVATAKQETLGVIYDAVAFGIL